MTNHPFIETAQAAVREMTAARDASGTALLAMAGALAIAEREGYEFATAGTPKKPARRFTVAAYRAALASDNRRESGPMTAAIVAELAGCDKDAPRYNDARALISSALPFAQWLNGANIPVELVSVSIASPNGHTRRAPTIAVPLTALNSAEDEYATAIFKREGDTCHPVLPRRAVAFERKRKDAKGKPVVDGIPHNAIAFREAAEVWLAANVPTARKRASKPKAMTLMDAAEFIVTTLKVEGDLAADTRRKLFLAAEAISKKLAAQREAARNAA